MGKKRVAEATVGGAADVVTPSQTAPEDLVVGEVIPYEAPKVEGEILAPASPKVDATSATKAVEVKPAAEKTIAYVIFPGVSDPPEGKYEVGDSINFPVGRRQSFAGRSDPAMVEDIYIKDHMVHVLIRSLAKEYNGQRALILGREGIAIPVWHFPIPKTLDPECVIDGNGNTIHRKFAEQKAT